MVVQRNWKILCDVGSKSTSTVQSNRSPVGIQSSSDDSNCSNHTTHSMMTAVANSPPHLKQDPCSNIESTMAFITTNKMAETMLQRLKQRFKYSATASGTNAETAMRSLELLRINIQASFDEEIDILIKKYVQKYFEPALSNIRTNLGQNTLLEDIIPKMSCALLENAKTQFNSFRTKHPQTQNVFNTSNNILCDQTLRMVMKRPLIKSEEDPTSCKKIVSNLSSQNPPTQIGAINQQLMSNKRNIPVLPARRQIFWNTASISTNTKFVLDVQANQAFGFGTDGKERVAGKHPELIRYLPDTDDREWLISKNIISLSNRNSRFLFLIYEEVCKLQQMHENYRSKSNINLALMQTFTVPEFVIQKMKLFFVDLNIKSRGLITNSFSIGALHKNSHLRNALMQGIQSNNNVKAEADHSISSSATSTTDSHGSKLRTSSLSSSHATLTALLNNSNQSK